jgi:hypothetical protein
MSGLRTRRRDFLVAMGAASTVAVTGCTGNGGGTTPAETTTPSPTTPNQEAVEHYESAIEVLIETKGTLDAWAESSFESERVGTLQDRVGSAREELAAAEEAADSSGDLIARINQATLIADVQELSLAYYEAVNVFFQVVSEAAQLGDNELHQRAADTYAEATGALDDARQVIADMGTALSELDNEALGESELEYTGEPLDHLDLVDMGAIDAAESYALANEDLHLAFVQFEKGQTHSDNEQFSEARTDWETGRQRAADSRDGFEAAIDNEFTPQNLRQDSTTKLGIAETMLEALDKFIEAATEAEAGNQEEASRLFSEGVEILEELP